MNSRFLRALVSLVALVFVAGVVGTVVDVALLALDAPQSVASPVSAAVAVTITLPLADAYTPLGRGVDTDALRERGRARLLGEVLLAAAAAFVAGGALAAAGVYLNAILGTFILVVIVGVVVGYGSFVVRNWEFYRDA
ncbi:hypothetical protein [Halarchaeum sp. P4]|uniref:hypothetical protein n=1 Tax=Halarchaeum sp. P4 TaxID=3421639 RepID=UPI003EB8A635